MSRSLLEDESDEPFRLLSLLEDQLLQISLPYLEAGENRILDDAGFLEDIQRIAARLDWVVGGCASEAAIKVWNAVDQRVSALTIQSKPTNVLILAVAVMVIRCTIENRKRPWQPITVSRSRSHPGFYSKLNEACHLSGMTALFHLPEDSQLRMLAAVLPEVSKALTPVPTGGNPQA